MKFTPGFHEELREVLHKDQLDIFGELEIHPPFRPGVRCKRCARPWNGEDARTSKAKAIARGCWWVSNKRTECPDCLRNAK
ncbi:MAG: hypothetical protein KGL35_04580 [Bradyrhizobium sp.]|nr:hypothetical protein [Bradyrhizobium sp.]